MAKDKKFTIIVPTYNHPDTLFHTLLTIFEAKLEEDTEVLVVDNSTNDDTEEVCHQFSVRYVRNRETQGMRLNWDYAVSCVKTEYFTIIGDDDGFVPDSMEVVRALLQAQPVDVLFWSPHLYWWPDAALPFRRNSLAINVPKMEAARDTHFYHVKSFIDNQENPWSFESLPGPYNGFVKKSVMDKIKTKVGCYFPHNSADVYSGCMVGIYAESSLMLQYPITVRGLSGGSGGVGFRGENWKETFERRKEELTETCGDELIVSSTVAIHCTAVKLLIKELFPTKFGYFNIDADKLSNGMLTEIYENKDRRDQILDEVRALCKKYNIEKDLSYWEKTDFAYPTKPVGVRGNSIGVDGSIIGIKNIRDACRLTKAIVG